MPKEFINTPNRMPAHSKEALGKAKALRQDMTDAEQLLWSRIRGKQLLDKEEQPLKFRKQVPIGHYIIDFYCPRYKLALECDGSQHTENKEYDDIRTEFLNAQGITVLRFWNNEVLTNIDGVLERVLLEVAG